MKAKHIFVFSGVFLTLLVTLIVVAVIGEIQSSFHFGAIHITVAQYENGYFSNRPSFCEFTTPLEESRKIAKFYIEFSDGRRFFLPDLSEKEAIKILKNNRYAPTGYFADDSRGEGRIDHANGNTTFTYQNGKLIWAHFETGSGLKISPNKDGPYLSFPIEEDDLIRVFGKPQWRSSSKPTGI